MFWRSACSLAGSAAVDVRTSTSGEGGLTVTRLTQWLIPFCIVCAWAGAAAQERETTRSDGAATVTDGSAAAEWTGWTEGRYRITPGDVLEVTFPFVPELNQTVTVQPDGYVTLREIADLRVQGRTVSQARTEIHDAYAQFVREPVFTLVLKEFERPYFVANGEVEKPGRYELRGATTVTQALAMAGGTRRGANTSRIVLYRRFGEEGAVGRQVDVSAMLAKKDLAEDPLLRPGDTIVVPKGVLGKVWPFFEVWRFR
jgi:polysaccharide export outer membrane protein